MADALVIVEFIAFLSVAALCIYLIVLFVRVRVLVMNMERDLKEISARAIPVLSNLEFITDRFRNVAQQVEDQIDAVSGSLQAIKSAADDVLMLERKVQQRIEEPIVEAASFLAAFYRGLRTFFDRMKD
ncbi:MAG TPA: hypothetical protein VIH68_07765 [Bacteroidota bacterium]